MKLNASLLVAAAMVLGSLSAMGCKSNDGATPPGSSTESLVAPEQTPDNAPTENATAAGFEQHERRFHYYAPRPPVARVEVRGRAPSERHFWAPGYYQWNGNAHVWYPGRWYLRRDGFEYVPAHWIEAGGRWEFVPGVWVPRR